MATKKKTSPANPKAQKIAELLSADESPLREQLATLVVDQLLSTTLAELVDVDETVNLIVSAAAGPNVQRAVTRHVQPSRDRLVAHWKKTRERPADLLGADLRLPLVASSPGSENSRAPIVA